MASLTTAAATTMKKMTLSSCIVATDSAKGQRPLSVSELSVSRFKPNLTKARGEAARTIASLPGSLFLREEL